MGNYGAWVADITRWEKVGVEILGEPVYSCVIAKGSTILPRFCFAVGDDVTPLSRDGSSCRHHV